MRRGVGSSVSRNVDTSGEMQTVHGIESSHSQGMQSGGISELPDQSGGLDELSDVERQEGGYPASRHRLLDLLKIARYELLNADGPMSRERIVRQIDDVLGREEIV